MPKKAPPVSGTFGVIADVHVGNFSKWGGPVVNGINRRCQLTLDALRGAVFTAESSGCSTLFVAGDLFHTRRPEPAVIAAVQQIFAVAKIRIVIVPGNHDMLDASAVGGNTACAPLWNEAAVVDKPVWLGIEGVDVLLVPFTSVVPMAQHLGDVLYRMKPDYQSTTGRPRVLITHVGVWNDEDAAPWMRKAKDGIAASVLLAAMEAAEIGMAFVGNYHEHNVWGLGEPQTIVQVGTLAPGGFGDDGLMDRGLLVVSDGDRFEKHEIPGPRFVIDRGTKILGPGGQDRNMWFVRQVGGEERSPEQVAKLGGYEIVGGDEEVVEAGSPDGPGDVQTPRQALEAYVDAAAWDAGVSKAAVMDLVQDCWAKGA